MISDDHFHIGAKSHVQTAWMLTRYAQKVFRSAFKPMKSKLRNIEAMSNITPLFMKISVIKPYCWSLITKNWKKQGFIQSLNITVLRHAGFREITPQSPYARAANSGDRGDSFVAGNQRKEGALLNSPFVSQI